MPPTKVHIRQGYKNEAWFTANANVVTLKAGQRVNLLQTGLYKLGDGTTILGALEWLGESATTFAELTDDPRDNQQLADYLDQKADRQSGLISGGSLSVDGDDITVNIAEYFLLGSGEFTTVATPFNNIALSSTGKQRFVAFYGTPLGTVIKVEGVEGQYAVRPDSPGNVLINYSLVTDSGLGSGVDLANYLLKSEKSSQDTNRTGTNDTTYVTPLGNAIKALAVVPKAADTTSNLHFYSQAFTGSAAENHPASINSLRGNAFFIETPLTLKAIGIRVSSTAVAGTNVQFGIYASLNGSPTGNAIYTSGSVSINTGVAATVKVTGISLSLPPGLYFIFMNVSASSGLIRTGSINAGRLLGIDISISSPTGINGLSIVGVTFGAWPDLTGVAAAYSSTTNVPAIYLGF